jgi:hypothetical protein
MVRRIRAVGRVIESTYNGVRVIGNTSFTFLALYVRGEIYIVGNKFTNTKTALTQYFLIKIMIYVKKTPKEK